MKHLLMISLSLTTTAAFSQVAEVSITDKACQRSTVEDGKLKTWPVALPGGPKPFICKHTTGKDYLCRSTRHNKQSKFQLVESSDARLILQSPKAIFARIDIDRKKKLFTVVAVHRSSRGQLVTEICHGDVKLPH